MRIVWTDLALRDLAFARAYVARDNPAAADKQVERVLGAVAALLRFPEIGRPGRRPGRANWRSAERHSSRPIVCAATPSKSCGCCTGGSVGRMIFDCRPRPLENR